jgi:uncharacterized protein YjdB
MTFKHRLSRRLALLRVAATVAALAVVASCDFLPDPSSLHVAQIVVVPSSTTVQPDQDYQFVGYGRTGTGDSVAVALVWSTTMGTISPGGRYVADSLEGDYEVHATLAQPEADATVSSGTSKVRVRRLAQLLVTPAGATLRTQGTQAFAAYGRLNGGDSVPVTVAWAATGGSISSAGLYTAGPTSGEYAVTATGKGFSTAAIVILTNIPVASVSVSPPSATLSIGATQQLSAVTKDSAGNTLTGRVVTWSSSNPSVATVSGSGLVTAIATGSATITATSEGKNGTSAVTVQAPPPVPPPVSHAGYYVAPTGSPTGNGSAASPWNLATALAHPAAVQPGDTIWLRGGTYPYAALTSNLTGTAANPIILRQYPGERAIVDGYMTVHGGYTWFWGFEILNSHLSDPEFMAFNLQAPGIKLINCIIHDAAGNGPGVWAAAIGAELYGNLIYNNGRMGSAPGRHGHGIYFQNATGTQRYVDNILFNGYAHNFHGYGEGVALNNLYFEGNVSFNAAQYTGYGGREYLIGGYQPVQNLTFTGNYSYRAASQGGGLNLFGYPDGALNPTGSLVTNNYLSGLVQLLNWSGATFTGNTLVNAPFEAAWVAVPNSAALANFNWNNNTYRWPGLSGGAQFVTITGAPPGVIDAQDFAEWRSDNGFDANSDFQHASPTGQVIRVRPNQYEPGRANVIVYNWSGAAMATVNLSNVLQPGDLFEVREVQNYFGTPAISGTYGGGGVALPMTAVVPPPPLGLTDFPALSTGTTFHAFVVLRK